MSKIKICFDSFSCKYENLLLMGDFNLEPMEEAMIDFMGLYDLKNLPRVYICYKKPQKSFYLNLFLRDKHLCFEDIFEQGCLISMKYLLQLQSHNLEK